MFRATNGETFLMTLKSNPLFIKIFPTLTIKHQVLGSPLTSRDLLLGKYLILDGLQKDFCKYNTFSPGFKYPIYSQLTPLTL